jgi:hypothetical protein
MFTSMENLFICLVIYLLTYLFIVYLTAQSLTQDNIVWTDLMLSEL